MGKLLTTSQYARLVGRSSNRVYVRCVEGKLPAIKIGNQWCIDEDTPYPEDGRLTSGAYVDWRKRYGKKSRKAE